MRQILQDLDEPEKKSKNFDNFYSFKEIKPLNDLKLYNEESSKTQRVKLIQSNYRNHEFFLNVEGDLKSHFYGFPIILRLVGGMKKRDQGLIVFNNSLIEFAKRISESTLERQEIFDLKLKNDESNNSELDENEFPLELDEEDSKTFLGISKPNENALRTLKEVDQQFEGINLNKDKFEIKFELKKRK